MVAASCESESVDVDVDVVDTICHGLQVLFISILISFCSFSCCSLHTSAILLVEYNMSRLYWYPLFYFYFLFSVLVRDIILPFFSTCDEGKKRHPFIFYVGIVEICTS